MRLGVLGPGLLQQQQPVSRPLRPKLSPENPTTSRENYHLQPLYSLLALITVRSARPTAPSPGLANLDSNAAARRCGSPSVARGRVRGVGMLKSPSTYKIYLQVHDKHLAEGEAPESGEGLRNIAAGMCFVGYALCARTQQGYNFHKMTIDSPR